MTNQTFDEELKALLVDISLQSRIKAAIREHLPEKLDTFPSNENPTAVQNGYYNNALERVERGLGL